MPTLLVLPLSISCLCRKRLILALPRPSSSTPRVSTPRVEDFPASTLPTTAVLTSMICSIDVGTKRIRKVE